MNQAQIKFVKELQKSVNEAQSALNRSDDEEYCSYLAQFIDAGIRICWVCQLAFGRGSQLVAEDAMKRSDATN